MLRTTRKPLGTKIGVNLRVEMYIMFRTTRTLLGTQIGGNWSVGEVYKVFNN